MKTRINRPRRRSTRTSISMPALMFVRALDRQQKESYPTFSDYIQALIRRDTLESRQ